MTFFLHGTAFLTETPAVAPVREKQPTGAKRPSQADAHGYSEPPQRAPHCVDAACEPNRS